MKKSLLKKANPFLIVAFVLLFVGTGHQAIAQQKQPTGITISPPFQQVKMLPNEQQHELIFSITNNENFSQTVNMASVDFNTLEDSGGLLYVGTNPTEIQKKYGLAHWLSLPTDKITLQPKVTTEIHAQIVNLPSFTPGGHYGAINLSLNESGDPVNYKNSVSIHPIASALLFVTKSGGEKYDIHLDNVKTNGSFFRLPSSASLRFYNPGNVHVIPRGIVKVTEMGSGRLIKDGVINQDSQLVLPEHNRIFPVVLKSVNRIGWGPVKNYKLSVDYRYDGIDKYTNQTINFQVWDFKLLATALISVFAVGYFSYRNIKNKK